MGPDTTHLKCLFGGSGDPIEPHAHSGHAVAGRLDGGADRIATAIGQIDLLGGVVPRHPLAGGDDRARELRLIGRSLCPQAMKRAPC